MQLTSYVCRHDKAADANVVIVDGTSDDWVELEVIALAFSESFAFSMSSFDKPAEQVVVLPSFVLQQIIQLSFRFTDFGNLAFESVEKPDASPILKEEVAERGHANDVLA